MGITDELEASSDQAQFVISFVTNHPNCTASEIENAYMESINITSPNLLYDRINDAYLQDMYELSWKKQDGNLRYTLKPIQDQIHPQVSRVIENSDGSILIKLKDISLDFAPMDVSDALSFVFKQRNLNPENEFEFKIHYSNRVITMVDDHYGTLDDTLEYIYEHHDQEMHSSIRFGDKLLKIFRVDVSFPL